MTEDAPPRLRLDKWLWHARFVKTRTLARKLCESGHVKVNGASVTKASATVKPGDRMEIVLGPWRRFLRVVALGDRRGPAPEAQGLYEQTAEPERLGGFRAEQGFAPAHRARGEGRPTKKERRQIDRFTDDGTP
jgi:ribosome-associated heat shock protein Hsp15